MGHREDLLYGAPRPTHSCCRRRDYEPDFERVVSVPAPTRSSNTLDVNNDNENDVSVTGGDDDSNGHKPKPEPVDLRHHLSRVANRRAPSVLKAMYKYFMIPGVKNLAAGMPPPEFFPFDTLEGVISNPDRLSKSNSNSNWGYSDSPLSPPPPPSSSTRFLSSLFSRGSAAPPPPPISHITVPKYPLSPPPNPFASFPPTTSTALQYSTADGYLPLRNLLLNFTLHHMHPFGIPYNSPTIVITNGNTDAINKVFETLLQEGDTFLVEKYTYLPAVSAGTPRGARAVPVEIDEEGIVVEGEGGLRWVLENWGRVGKGVGAGRGGRKWRKPRLLYTIPIGQNPTGVITGVERKREVYKVCEEHDVIIMEDDPYWHLQYPPTSSSSPPTTPGETSNKGSDFLRSLIPSYLTIDTSGRVLRLDTFSKTIAPGCRLGWITGQPVLIERLLRANEGNTGPPSGFVQALVAELLSERNWGINGFVAYCERLRDRYREKMEAMLGVLEGGREAVVVRSSSGNLTGQENDEDVDQDEDEDDTLVIDKLPIISFTAPRAGMFVWVKIHFQNHPLYQSPSSTSKFSAQYLATKLFQFLAIPKYDYKVLIGPGHMFFAAGAAVPTVPASPHLGLQADQNDDEEGDTEEKYCFTRLSFSTLNKRECIEATVNFVQGLGAFWGLSKEEMEEINDLDLEQELGMGQSVGVFV